MAEKWKLKISRSGGKFFWCATRETRDNNSYTEEVRGHKGYKTVATAIGSFKTYLKNKQQESFADRMLNSEFELVRSCYSCKYYDESYFGEHCDPCDGEHKWRKAR